MDDRVGLRDGRPIRLGPVMPHVWRVKRMARATGVDLVGAMADDRLSSEGWARIVSRCRGCASAAACDRWLSVNDSADAARDGCDNRRALAALTADLRR